MATISVSMGLGMIGNQIATPADFYTWCGELHHHPIKGVVMEYERKAERDCECDDDRLCVRGNRLTSEWSGGI